MIGYPYEYGGNCYRLDINNWMYAYDGENSIKTPEAPRYTNGRDSRE